MTVGYTIPDHLLRSRKGSIFETGWGWFLISLLCFVSAKAYWKHLS